MTYFPTEDERKIDTKRLNWFLRTPGKYSNQVASVDLNGNIYDYYDVNTTGEVRPAMYVKLTD
jgi:hypothetical protein